MGREFVDNKCSKVRICSYCMTGVHLLTLWTWIAKSEVESFGSDMLRCLFVVYYWNSASTKIIRNFSLVLMLLYKISTFLLCFFCKNSSNVVLVRMSCYREVVLLAHAKSSHLVLQEMMGLTYFISDQSRKEAEYCMENAFTTYLVCLLLLIILLYLSFDWFH